MKSIIIAAILLSAMGDCGSAQTIPVTPNLGLQLIPDGYQNWGVPYRTTMNTIDSKVAPKLNPSFTGTFTLPTTLNGCLFATNGVVSANGLACGSGGSSGTVLSGAQYLLPVYTVSPNGTTVGPGFNDPNYAQLRTDATGGLGVPGATNMFGGSTVFGGLDVNDDNARAVHGHFHMNGLGDFLVNGTTATFNGSGALTVNTLELDINTPTVISSSGNLTNFGFTNLDGPIQLAGNPGTSGQVLTSAGSSVPTWQPAYALPQATTSVLGGVKCDGTTITCTSGVIAAVGGSSMVYPGAGVAVSTGSAWGTSKATPTGDLVGTSDTQTLTNKTLTAPTLTSATTDAITVTGSGIPIATGTSSNTDLAGQITLASGAGSYTLTATYLTAPIVVCSDTTAAAAVKCVATTTTITFAGTGTDVINYIVVGRT